MTEDDFRPSGSDGGAEANKVELARLSSLHEDLVEAVHSAVNPTVRDDLTAELRSVRERVVELTGAGSVAGSIPGLDDLNGIAPQMFAADASGASNDIWAEGGNSSASVSGGALVPVNVPGYDPNAETSGGGIASLIRTPLVPLGLAIFGALALGGLFFFGGDDADDNEVASLVADPTDTTDPAGASAAGSSVVAVRSALTDLGYDSITATVQGNQVVLSGELGSADDRDRALATASAVAGNVPVDGSGLTVAGAGTSGTSGAASVVAASSLQRDIDRLLGATPITFSIGQVDLSERHRRILNNIVPALSDHPELAVSVVGFTDGTGTPEANLLLSETRAQNVVDYLVEQGVPAEQLSTDAAGESESSGATGLAPLERRVEFVVLGANTATVEASASDGIQVAVIAQSAGNDLAFSQSMVDSLARLGQSTTLEVSIEENLIPAEAEEAIAGYAAEGFDLVIAHSYQYGPAVAAVAPDYPGVVFAWGTGTDTFGLDNVYAYDAEAQEGGYVMGTMAALLSESGTIGFVGPLEIGDAVHYATGFQAGALAQRPGTSVLIDYTGSFSELGLAAEAARSQVDQGADVLTGSAQMVVGAVDVAATSNTLWFGNQADQSALAPDLVVASQVYRWEVVLEEVLAEVAGGQPQGRALSLDLVNGGLTVEFNASYPLPESVRARADEVLEAVTSGIVVPPS